MDILKILQFALIFFFGFLSANLISFFLIYGLENPLSNGFGFVGNGSNPAPHDFVDEGQIQIYPDKVVINIEGASMSRYAPTGSMKPILDYGSNGIRIKPSSPDDIDIGDIITYERDGILIVHRVVDKDMDQEGYFFITKGDNNSINDGVVRFDEVRYLTIGVIY